MTGFAPHFDSQPLHTPKGTRMTPKPENATERPREGGAWGTWTTKIADLEAENTRLRAELHHSIAVHFRDANLISEQKAAHHHRKMKLDHAAEVGARNLVTIKLLAAKLDTARAERDAALAEIDRLMGAFKTIDAGADCDDLECICHLCDKTGCPCGDRNNNTAATTPTEAAP